MWVAIFKAVLGEDLNGYADMVAELRLAVSRQPGFIRMDSVCENGEEITLSYWDSMEAIHTWGKHPLHQLAQQKGKEKWYSAYSVEFAEIVEE